MWLEANKAIKDKLYSVQRRAYLLSNPFRLRFLLLIITISSLLVLSISLCNLILRGTFGYMLFSALALALIATSIGLTIIGVQEIWNRLQYFREVSNNVYYSFGILQDVLEDYDIPTAQVKLKEGVYLLSSLIVFSKEDIGKKVIVFSHFNKPIKKPYSMDNYLVIDYEFFKKCEIYT